MLVTLLLGSDKTTVSVATGQNDYYPLYLSIGNITNRIRWAHEDGVIVIGFLAIPKCVFTLPSFFITYSYPPKAIAKTRRVVPFVTFVRNYSIHHCRQSLNPSGLPWRHQTWSAAQMATSGALSTPWVHTLQITQNKFCYLALYLDGARS